MLIIYTCADSPDDREFMIRLYNDYERLMFFVAKKYISDNASREDIVQESLLSLIRNIDKLKPLENRSLAAYIHTTVSNTAINYLRKNTLIQKYTVQLDDDSLAELESYELPLDEMLLILEEKEGLAAAISMLDDEERILIEGKYFLNYTDKKLAQIIGCKPASIRMKLTRARRKVFKTLRETEEVANNDKT